MDLSSFIETESLIKGFLKKEWVNIKNKKWVKGTDRQAQLNILSNMVLSKTIGPCVNEHVIPKDGYGGKFKVDGAVLDDEKRPTCIVLNKSLLVSINKNARNSANCTVGEAIGRIAMSDIPTLNKCIFFTLIPRKTFVLGKCLTVKHVENTKFIDIPNLGDILNPSKVKVKFYMIKVIYDLPERMINEKTLDILEGEEIVIQNIPDIINQIGAIK
jgi:hypothetical protein